MDGWMNEDSMYNWVINLCAVTDYNRTKDERNL